MWRLLAVLALMGQIGLCVAQANAPALALTPQELDWICLLYTSDAAD